MLSLKGFCFLGNNIIELDTIIKDDEKNVEFCIIIIIIKMFHNCFKKISRLILNLKIKYSKKYLLMINQSMIKIFISFALIP